MKRLIILLFCGVLAFGITQAKTVEPVPKYSTEFMQLHTFDFVADLMVVNADVFTPLVSQDVTYFALQNSFVVKAYKENICLKPPLLRCIQFSYFSNYNYCFILHRFDKYSFKKPFTYIKEPVGKVQKNCIRFKFYNKKALFARLFYMF